MSETESQVKKQQPFEAFSNIFPSYVGQNTKKMIYVAHLIDSNSWDEAYRLASGKVMPAHIRDKIREFFKISSTITASSQDVVVSSANLLWDEIKDILSTSKEAELENFFISENNHFTQFLSRSKDESTQQLLSMDKKKLAQIYVCCIASDPRYFSSMIKNNSDLSFFQKRSLSSFSSSANNDKRSAKELTMFFKSFCRDE